MANINESARTLATSEAALYLTERGVRISRRSLEAFRSKQPSAAGDLGPEFARDGSGRCWYSIADLDRWIDAKLNARRRRAALEQPIHLAQARAARTRLDDRSSGANGLGDAPPKAA